MYICAAVYQICTRVIYCTAFHMLITQNSIRGTVVTTKSLLEFYLFHVTNVEQRQGLPTFSPTNFDHESACVGCYYERLPRHLVLLNLILILPSHGE